MDLSKYLQKAKLALGRRNAAQAITLYRQVLRAEPDHGEAQLGLLEAFARQAELRGGPTVLDRTAARGLAATARGLVAAGRPGPAAKTCESGLARHPRDAALAALLAHALEALGRSEAALATWHYRLRLDEGDFEALKSAGLLHYRLGQIDEATRCLERAHDVDPRDPEVERLRKDLAAEGTLAATRFETAASSRELARNREQLDEAARRHHGEGTPAARADEAGRLEAELAASPDDVPARARLVAALLAGGELERAGRLVEEGLARAPGDAALAELRGEVRLRVSEAAVRRARREAEARAGGGGGGEAKAEGPGLEELLLSHARLEIEELGPRLAADPSRAEWRLRVARAHERLGQVDGAIEHYQALVGDSRHELEARVGLGRCFTRKKLLPLAQRQLEAALALAGGVGSARGKDICYHLGLVAERLGDNPRALSRYLEVYEVDIHFKDVGAKIEQLGS